MNIQLNFAGQDQQPEQQPREERADAGRVRAAEELREHRVSRRGPDRRSQLGGARQSQGNDIFHLI